MMSELKSNLEWRVKGSYPGNDIKSYAIVLCNLLYSSEFSQFFRVIGKTTLDFLCDSLSILKVIVHD